jgi:hypothetical protein
LDYLARITLIFQVPPYLIYLDALADVGKSAAPERDIGTQTAIASAAGHHPSGHPIDQCR